VDLDSANNAWVVGYTLSEDFPTTNNALNASDMAEDDVFLFALSANGSEMVYSVMWVGAGMTWATGSLWTQGITST